METISKSLIIFEFDSLAKLDDLLEYLNGLMIEMKSTMDGCIVKDP